MAISITPGKFEPARSSSRAATSIRRDHFTYTIADNNLPDFEWLWEVGLWLTWDHFGYGGLKLIKTLLVASTLLLLAWRLRVAGLRWHGIGLGLTIAVAALSPAWNLRPLFCTTIGLLVLSGWLHDHATGRKPLSWWLPLLMVVWANCHPAVITGQALLLGAIAWEWLNRWLRVNKPLDKAALKRLSVIGGVGLLATFIGPDPVGRLLYPFKPELAHPIQRVFVEMQPLYATVDKAPYTSGLVYVVAALVGISVVLRFRQYRGWEIMLLLALGGASQHRGARGSGLAVGHACGGSAATGRIAAARRLSKAGDVGGLPWPCDVIAHGNGHGTVHCCDVSGVGRWPQWHCFLSYQ